MIHIKTHLYKHHKKYLYGTIAAVVVIGGILGLYWNKIYFHHYCQNPELCACLENKFSDRERDAFIALEKYTRQTGQAQPDGGILKYTSAESIQEMHLKTRSCLADIARQKMLDNTELKRFSFAGDYNCMRQTLMNALSNDEVVFLESPQSKDLNLLRTNPQIREMYLQTSPKLMRCMSPDIQRQYLAEVQALQASLNAKNAQVRESSGQTPTKPDTGNNSSKSSKKK